MKEEIALQKVQITSQQGQIASLQEDLSKLSEIVEKLQESQAATATTFGLGKLLECEPDANARQMEE
jgi:protein subunit release factor A